MAVRLVGLDLRGRPGVTGAVQNGDDALSRVSSRVTSSTYSEAGPQVRARAARAGSANEPGCCRNVSSTSVSASTGSAAGGAGRLFGFRSGRRRSAGTTPLWSPRIRTPHRRRVEHRGQRLLDGGVGGRRASLGRCAGRIPVSRLVRAAFASCSRSTLGFCRGRFAASPRSPRRQAAPGSRRCTRRSARRPAPIWCLARPGTPARRRRAGAGRPRAVHHVIECRAAGVGRISRSVTASSASADRR